MRICLSLLASLLAPVAAIAHPHIFIATSVEVVFDEAGSVSINLTWEYDQFFSLLLTADAGLDLDGDLILTADEQRRLESEIAVWPEDFTGDLEVTQAGEVLPLAGHVDHTMIYENGLFIERHRRPVAAAVTDADPLVVRVYDPSFYTAYDLTGPVTVAGREDCKVEVIRADLDAAYALAESLMEGVSFDQHNPEDPFPAVGDAFADTIEITCAGQP